MARKNIKRYGILIKDGEPDRMITCRVMGEMADGSKVWQEIDAAGDYIDGSPEYLLFTRGGWSVFEEL